MDYQGRVSQAEYHAALDRRDRREDELKAQIKRLREAMRLAAEIIDRNLYYQREKVQDASSLLKDAMSVIQ